MTHHPSFPLTAHFAQVPEEKCTRMCTVVLLKQQKQSTILVEILESNKARN